MQKVPGIDVDQPTKNTPLIDYHPKPVQDEKDIWTYTPAQDLAIGAKIVLD